LPELFVLGRLIQHAMDRSSGARKGVPAFADIWKGLITENSLLLCKTKAITTAVFEPLCRQCPAARFTATAQAADLPQLLCVNS